MADISVLEMARGAIIERANYEMTRIVNNILDPNTNPTKKRSLTITIDFFADNERQLIRTSTTAKSKLEATNPIAGSLFVRADSSTGEYGVVEATPQLPGQRNLDGTEQGPPKIIRMA